MVELEINDEGFVCKLKGLHQLWALRRRIEVPIRCVRAVKLDPEVARGWWKGLRLGGTNIPGLITAGTFYFRGQWIFFDVRKPERTVVIDLVNHRYDRLVIELEDPEKAVLDISRAAGLAEL